MKMKKHVQVPLASGKVSSSRPGQVVDLPEWITPSLIQHSRTTVNDTQ